MRPASLALLLFALAGGAVGWVTWREVTEESRAWSALLALDGKILEQAGSRENPELKAIQNLFARFARMTGNLDTVGYFPWYVQRFHPDSASERVLLLRIQRNHMIPGRDEFSAEILGTDRRPLFSCFFGGPWRSWVRHAAPFSRPSDPTPYLRLRADEQMGGLDGGIVYAIVDDELALVRIEDQKGKIVRNQTYAPNHRLDPVRPPPSADRLAARLSSPRPADILSALTYLGGFHFLPSDTVDRTVIYQEDSEIRSVAAARSDPALRARILELRKSPDPWIREAAAAVPLDGTK